jgi:hypothetical protein
MLENKEQIRDEKQKRRSAQTSEETQCTCMPSSLINIVDVPP